MTKNSIKGLLEIQETLRRHFDPIAEVLKNLEENVALSDLDTDFLRHHGLIRTVSGPLDELSRSGLLSMESSLVTDLQPMLAAVGEAERRFRLPESVEIAKLALEFGKLVEPKGLMRYQTQLSEIETAMLSMHEAWLDIGDMPGSIAGFVGLQSIGQALRTTPAFDTQFTDLLRVDLGDWRKEIAWPPNIFVDPLARASFYCEQGFNSALTAFPSNAFDQGVVVTGLKGPSSPLVQAYNIEPEEENEEEAAFERTNAAHDRLQRFETQIRRFIDERMKAKFGENWIKQQVPGTIRKAWLDKRKKARDNGEPERPLIAYADFSDYVPIIERGDNWKNVFAPIFRRKTFVQESFQRLYPIRICTMHARLITQDDELFLFVETKRILKAIGVEN